MFEEFKTIFAKVTDPQDEITKTIQGLGKVDFLLFSGQFVGNKNSNIDMLVVGDIGKDNLKKYIESELATKNVKFSVMSRADFLYRLDCKDKFVMDVLASDEKTIPVNKLEKYITVRLKGTQK